MFELLWTSGDKTWMPYHEIEGWIQLEQYFEILGIEEISEIKAIHTADESENDSDEEVLLGLGAVSLEEVQDRDLKVQYKKGRKSRRNAFTSSPPSVGNPELDDLLLDIIKDQEQRLLLQSNPVSKKLLIPRELMKLCADYGYSMQFKDFDPDNEPAAFDLIASHLLHCPDIDSMLPICHRDLNNIYGPVPESQTAPSVPSPAAPASSSLFDKKGEKLFMSMLVNKAYKDMEFQERRQVERETGGKSGKGRGKKRSAEAVDDIKNDASLFMAHPKKAKVLKAKGKGPITQPSPRPEKASKPTHNAPKAVAKAQSSAKKAQTVGKNTHKRGRIIEPGPAPPAPPIENTSAYENPSPFNRDNRNSGSGSGIVKLWESGQALLETKPETWTDEDYAGYCNNPEVVELFRAKKAKELDDYLAEEDEEEQTEPEDEEDSPASNEMAIDTTI
ncbi:hypothetical protein C8J56DRAFT_1052479 [Mycena floridula]|nr:hypothetical protein C8J56DRAFT_1052479 [Mycena floridula]